MSVVADSYDDDKRPNTVFLAAKANILIYFSRFELTSIKQLVFFSTNVEYRLE